jgi:protein gp37
MKRWPQKPVRLDENELKIPMTTGNFIFVGSSCDMFSDEIPNSWILDILNHCRQFNNRYLFQSKNTFNMLGYLDRMPENSCICTTLETNRYYKNIMNESPTPLARVEPLSFIPLNNVFITIEPIMDFDLIPFVEMIKRCNPEQVNIGSDSGNNRLPEPPKEKLLELIAELSKFTKINKKTNLNRMLK